MQQGYTGFANLRGYLADTWQIVGIGDVKFHIRQGVHWAPNPTAAGQLVGGRLYTADDAVYNINRYFTAPLSYTNLTEPAMAKAASVTKLDAQDIEIKTPVNPWTGMLIVDLSYYYFEFPPEVVQKYGNMLDWHNSVGTGPFMLTDFVSNASATMVRNPNYWMTDPVGPGKGNQLPYVDQVNILTIPDISTQLAAIRTGKADWLTGITRDDANSLKQTQPLLKSVSYFADAPYVIGMRQDNPKLPFSDLRVRQALMMATDFNSLKNNLFGGQAEINIFPIGPVKGFETAYVPLNQLPADVQALYNYNPDQAKQLLSAAGYPNGFKTTVVCRSIGGDADFVSALADMWSKVGITLGVDVQQPAAWQAIGRNFDQMKLANITGIPTYANMPMLSGVSNSNPSRISDPKIDAVLAQITANLLDQTKTEQLFHDMIPYVLSQAYVIPVPEAYEYVFWWPWVQNYVGEQNIIYYSVQSSWAPYVWIDQNLKKQMGY